MEIPTKKNNKVFSRNTFNIANSDTKVMVRENGLKFDNFACFHIFKKWIKVVSVHTVLVV